MLSHIHLKCSHTVFMGFPVILCHYTVCIISPTWLIVGPLYLIEELHEHFRSPLWPRLQTTMCSSVTVKRLLSSLQTPWSISIVWLAVQKMTGKMAQKKLFYRVTKNHEAQIQNKTEYRKLIQSVTKWTWWATVHHTSTNTTPVNKKSYSFTEKEMSQ